MTSQDFEQIHQDGRSRGAAWLYMPIILILLLGVGLSIAAHQYSDVELSVAESVAAGFGGLVALILGLVAAAIGVIGSLFAALLAIIAAGGAVAVTIFILVSPVVALVLIAVLMRRRRNDCPDPGVHPNH